MNFDTKLSILEDEIKITKSEIKQIIDLPEEVRLKNSTLDRLFGLRDHLMNIEEDLLLLKAYS